MFFVSGGREDASSESDGLSVDALKDLWGIGEEKPPRETLPAPVSTDIYKVPSVLRVVPRRAGSRHR